MDSIGKIVSRQKGGAKNQKDFLDITSENRSLINELYDEILITKVVELENSLSEWVIENNALDYFIELTKENSSGGDLLYLGYWSVIGQIVDENGYLVNLNPDEEQEELNPDIDFMLSIFNTMEHKYQTNNFNSEPKVKFTIPLNNLSKLYDYFIPEKTLAKYRAEILKQELTKNDINTNLSKI